MSELKQQLEALRIDDEGVRPRRARYLVAALALLGLAVAIVAWRSRRWAGGRRSRDRDSRPCRPPAAPDPTSQILTASGYVVARRKAVVSAKIQGRLADLRVEEGSRVREGELIARLESADYAAQVTRAKARVGKRPIAGRAGGSASIARAEADLAEARRQVALLEKLVAERVASTDERDAARSRVAIAEAALGQAQGGARPGGLGSGPGRGGRARSTRPCSRTR